MQLITLAALLPFALAAPLIQQPGAQLVQDQFIIKLKDGASDRALQNALRHVKNGNVKHSYRNTRFKGFAAKLNRQTLEEIRKLPEVEYVEQDAVVRAYSLVTQENVPWGLGRISHRQNLATTYVYDESAGEDTCSYIVDTGIYVEHNEFEGRAEWLVNTIDTDDTDGNGHGTHVAGTVGGVTFGVAKKTRLFGVKVLDKWGSGTWSSVIAGIDFVASDAANRTAAGECQKGAVANLSLGGYRNDAVNSAVAAAVNSGVVFVVAAGNSGDDAYWYSPASEPTAITVGASDFTDTVAYFSNYGATVDVFAPGVNVASAWIGGVDETNAIDGTSMASPHVAGLAAYILGLQGPKTPAEISDIIRNTSTTGVLSGLSPDTFNGVAFNGATE
ncbi:hypothetical protein VTJ83DRAFT_7518 [Remersonia thermophila]|uniref:Uncharacterized protein n=1 Tax=Remersonia thermophila TaxID=72144 RepID=A0ABR4D3U7_9PEZI